MLFDKRMALPHRIERVARAGILFDNKPLGAGFISGLDDCRPVQVAVADLHDGGVVILCANAVIFEVQQREAAVEARDPFLRAFAAGGDPIGVDLALKVFGIGKVVKVLQPRRLIIATQ